IQDHACRAGRCASRIGPDPLLMQAVASARPRPSSAPTIVITSIPSFRKRAEDRGWPVVTEGPTTPRTFGSGLSRPERGVDHVGPNGSPNQYHARNTRIQTIMVHQVYGSISATIVPTPALFSYSCANPTTNARCGFSGLMTLVGESLTR